MKYCIEAMCDLAAREYFSHLAVQLYTDYFYVYLLKITEEISYIFPINSFLLSIISVNFCVPNHKLIVKIMTFCFSLEYSFGQHQFLK